MKDRDFGHIDRRTFLKAAGTAGAAAGLVHAPGIIPFAHAAETPDAAEIIHGKSPEMIVHNAKLGVMETPLDMLRDHQFTPADILYNRTHFPVDGAGQWMATTEPSGSATRPTSVDPLARITASTRTTIPYGTP